MSLNDDLDKKIIPFDANRGRKPAIAKILASLDFPDITTTGAIRPTCANTRIAIDKLGVTCDYDEFHDKLLIGGQPIGQHAGELSDHACVYLREMIEQEFGFDPGRAGMQDACMQLCLKTDLILLLIISTPCNGTGSSASTNG